MKRFLLLLAICLSLLVFAGCTGEKANVPIEYQWASTEGSQINEAKAGEQFYFSVPVDEAMLERGAPIKIKVSGIVNHGTLRFELRSPDGKAVWNSGTIKPGEFSMNMTYGLPAGVTGTYTIGLVYSDNTSASYNLSFYAFKLGLGVLLSGSGMILVSLGFILYAARQHLLGWRYLLLGGLFWLLTVAVKFAFAIPVNPVVFQALGFSYENIFSPANLVAYLYIGALTGIFEAGLAWLILSRVRWGRATWSQALVFGIGFGVIEALLLGLLSLSSGVFATISPDALPAYTLGSLAMNSSLVMGTAPIFERLMVILAHIFSCVLIFYAIARGEARWAWLSILYKTLLDTPAGFAQFWGVSGSPAKLWTIEAVIAVFGLIALLGTVWIARRYPQEAAQVPEPESLPVSA